MITHNGTYLLHATHHGMPIVAATMGGKMVIGWLQSATLQAIVAAFGAEGTEVIRKTNDYLNRIATTDPQRALQLAGFINEDPLLVCSLVETSKTRWLVGDGKAYINSGWIPKENDFEVRTRFIYTRIGTNMVLYANTWNEGNGLVFMHGASNSYIQTATSVLRNVYLGITAGADVKMSHKLSSVTTEINGKTMTSSTGASSINNTQPVWIMAKQNGADLIFDGLLAYWQLLFGDETQAHFVPCQHGGENGMLDILSGTFYPNANTEGSFTIAITPTTPA